MFVQHDVLQVDVKAVSEPDKIKKEARKKEQIAMLKADKQTQRKQSTRKWSNIVTGSISKPLAKTTSAPPTADLCQGSFKSSVSTAQPQGSNSSISASNKADANLPKLPLHSILKQQASSMTPPPGSCLRLALPLID